MEIPTEYNWRYIFHFTDIRNLDSIIKNGLLCTNAMIKKGLSHQDIANSDIQQRRAAMKVTCGKGGVVHDYVPFYFTSKNPMFLSVLNKKNHDQPFFIYLCVKINRLEKDDAVFTSHSANTNNPPTFYDDVNDLNKLDWKQIDSKKWKFTDEERHRKMAEALIFDKMDVAEIDSIVVYNSDVAKIVRWLFERNGKQAPEILFDGGLSNGKYRFFYTKYFFDDRKWETLVMGPYFMRQKYRELLKDIRQERKKPRQYKYKDIASLLQAVANDFCVLPELQGIYGLSTNNIIHTATVDEHTRCVVENVRQTDCYKSANPNDQKILLLAAYLHDIGKGPKEKWQGEVQYIYPDHPYDAAFGLQRILSEEIECIETDDIRRSCLLVLFHDIVGDCLFKGRDRQQIVRIIADEKDIDMLIALGIADAKSLNSTWYEQMKYCCKNFKKDIVSRKGL